MSFREHLIYHAVSAEKSSQRRLLSLALANILGMRSHHLEKALECPIHVIRSPDVQNSQSWPLRSATITTVHSSTSKMNTHRKPQACANQASSVEWHLRFNFTYTTPASASTTIVQFCINQQATFLTSCQLIAPQIRTLYMYSSLHVLPDS